MKTCSDVMTKSPTCVLAQDPVSKAAEIMKNEDIGAVPVLESEETPRLLGLVTDRDIVIRCVADGQDVRSMSVQDVMSGQPVTCRAEDPLVDAFDKMAQHQIRRLPVVDANEHVIGIISQADIATRVDRPKQTAGMLEEISQPVGG